MPQRLSDLVRNGKFDDFEARCLALLEAGTLPLAELAWCFRELEKAGQSERITTLAPVVFENIDVAAHPKQALHAACVALAACPNSEDLRSITIELYRRNYADTPGFAAVLESSGLTTGRPARAALRTLDFGLALDVGDTLISRLDDRVVEVVEVDRQRGLFTLRRAESITTLPAREVVREYERISPDDFRVLQKLRPERLADMLHNDPVAVVIGLISAHGDRIDSDQLKHELVPRFIEPKDWSKWWSHARTQLKRSPHVVMEGRSPIVFSHSPEGISLEDEIWEALAGSSEPAEWLRIFEGYLRELKERKAAPSSALLGRVREHVVRHIAQVRSRRPGEAFAAGLVLDRMQAKTAGGAELAGSLADEIIRDAARPADMIAKLSEDVLWEAGLAALQRTNPAGWGDVVVALLPVAPASMLDHLCGLLRQAERLDAMQAYIDDALADLVHHPELVYWLWKGPKQPAGLQLPTDGELLTAILDTLIAMDMTLSPTSPIGREFAGRMKSAFALRDFGKVCAELRKISAAAAITLRRQIERLGSLSDAGRSRMLRVLREAHPDLWVVRRVRVEPWEDPDVLWCTAAGIERKCAERDELVNVKMHENAKRIGEAASLGDLSENSEYKFALEERDFLRARLAQINRDLLLARALSREEIPTEYVGIGCRVKLQRVGQDGWQELTILGPFETDVEGGVLNYKAPVCQGLMGRKVGERVTFSLTGDEVEYEIAGIENALQGV
jgi:transcription elongation GreA/GreB family factor